MNRIQAKRLLDRVKPREHRESRNGPGEPRGTAWIVHAGCDRDGDQREDELRCETEVATGIAEDGYVAIFGSQGGDHGNGQREIEGDEQRRHRYPDTSPQTENKEDAEKRPRHRMTEGRLWKVEDRQSVRVEDQHKDGNLDAGEQQRKLAPQTQPVEYWTTITRSRTTAFSRGAFRGALLRHYVLTSTTM